MKITTEHLKKIILEELEGITEQPHLRLRLKPNQQSRKGSTDDCGKVGACHTITDGTQNTSRNVQTAEEAINYWLELLEQVARFWYCHTGFEKILAAKSKEP